MAIAKKKEIKKVHVGKVYIHATFNNTIITATDLNGNVLAWCSAGVLGFRGAKKATPFAAGQIIKNLVEKVRPTGLGEVHVFVRGVGAGRDAAVRALNANSLRVVSIKDMTPLPHNGPRPPRPRRV